MTYSENYFRKYPTPKDKTVGWRRFSVLRARSDPEEEVKKIADEYFTKPTAKSLKDPARCALMLQKIMSSNSETHMENLSDFVAICFVFSYKNPQSQPYSINLLNKVLQICQENDQDSEKKFKFEDPELELIIKTMIEEPPANYKDKCAQFIQIICKKSKACRGTLAQSFIKNHTAEQVEFLKNIRKYLDLSSMNFTDDELQYINSDLKAQPTTAKKEIKPTPGDRIIEDLQKKEMVETINSRFKNCQSFFFIIFTIILLIIIILSF